MDFIYFDNASTTFPKPQEVYDYTIDMYKNYGMNINRSFSSDNKIPNIVHDTRELIKELVNVKYGYEAIFTPTATIALNQVLFGIDYVNIKNVYVSPFEHNSVLRTLNEIKKKVDINIINLDFDVEKWEYDFDKIKYNFTNYKPDMIIVNHVSNVFGYISPIEEIGNLSKIYNSLYIVDACQSLGVEDIDISKFNIDFLVYAGHKTLYSPFGISGFIYNKNIKLKPFIIGGTGTDSSIMEMPNETPTMYEAGSQNIMSMFGLYKSLNWIKDTKVENIRKNKLEITSKLINILSKYDYIQMYIPTQNHTSIVSFKIKGYPIDSIAQLISEKYGIILRYGLHCAPNAHHLTNTYPEGTIRFSIGYFTTDEDLEKLDKALENLEYEI